MSDVQGKCPACGRESLFLGSGGYVTCREDDCPMPDAASDEVVARVRREAKAEALRGASSAALICELADRIEAGDTDDA